MCCVPEWASRSRIWIRKWSVHHVRKLSATRTTDAFQENRAGVGCVLIGAACRSQEALDPSEIENFDLAEVAGFYALHQVDGHAIGWYHHMAAVDCQIAFIDGELELAPNANFELDLGYHFRCIGTNPVDGSGTMKILGKIRYI